MNSITLQSLSYFPLLVEGYSPIIDKISFVLDTEKYGFTIKVYDGDIMVRQWFYLTDIVVCFYETPEWIQISQEVHEHVQKEFNKIWRNKIYSD